MTSVGEHLPRVDEALDWKPTSVKRREFSCTILLHKIKYTVGFAFFK